MFVEFEVSKAPALNLQRCRNQKSKPLICGQQKARGMHLHQNRVPKPHRETASEAVREVRWQSLSIRRDLWNNIGVDNIHAGMVPLYTCPTKGVVSGRYIFMSLEKDTHRMDPLYGPDQRNA